MKAINQLETGSKFEIGANESVAMLQATSNFQSGRHISSASIRRDI